MNQGVKERMRDNNHKLLRTYRLPPEKGTVDSESFKTGFNHFYVITLQFDTKKNQFLIHW